MKYSFIFAVAFLLPSSGCLSITDPADPDYDALVEPTSTAQSPLIGTAVATITFKNNGTTTATSSGLNFAGTVSPTPAAMVLAGQSNQYVETGITNISSFHIDYTAGNKKCHFDVAAVPSAGTIFTPPSCMFTKNAQSQGTASATCTATLTAFDLNTCSQSISFSMQ